MVKGNSVTDSRTDPLVPAALTLMARLECASWAQHPGLTQLSILRSICHQCIYLYNIFHTGLSKKGEIMLIIWCSGISLCQAWHWLKIEDWILFQWQFESVTHFHSGFKVTEGKWKVPFRVVCCFHYFLEVWLADLLYSLSCIHEMGHTNWYEVIWILEFPGQSSNKSTDNFSHLEQDSHWLNHFIWVFF